MKPNFISFVAGGIFFIGLGMVIKDLIVPDDDFHMLAGVISIIVGLGIMYCVWRRYHD